MARAVMIRWLSCLLAASPLAWGDAMLTLHAHRGTPAVVQSFPVNQHITNVPFGPAIVSTEQEPPASVTITGDTMSLDTTGTDTWLQFDNLNAGKTYEMRVSSPGGTWGLQITNAGAFDNVPPGCSVTPVASTITVSCTASATERVFLFDGAPSAALDCKEICTLRIVANEPQASSSSPPMAMAATPAPGFDVTWQVLERGSQRVIEPNATKRAAINSFYDILVRPDTAPFATAPSATFGGQTFNGNPSPFDDDYTIRLEWVTAETQTAVVTAEGETFVFYVAPPEDVPAGVYPNVADGAVIEDREQDIAWTYGPAPVGCNLQGLTSELVRLPSTVINGAGLADDSLAGIHEMRQTGTLSYGDYEIRTTYDCEPDPDTVEVSSFSVPAPTPEPFDTSLTIFNPTIYSDGEVSAQIYTDHIHSMTRRWLTVDSTEHDLPLQAGSDPEVWTARDYGMGAAGSYGLQVHASFSDTAPTLASSPVVSVTVQPAPIGTYLDQAFDTPTDSAALQAIVDDPDASARQKEIASSLIGINDEIANPHSGFPVAQAQADRQIYVDEQQSKPLDQWQTFDEWFAAQRNWNDPGEVAQARATVANAPTSSLDALVTYWNQYFAFDSMEYALQTGIGTFFRQLQADGFPDSMIVGGFQQYQRDIATSGFLFTFQDWVSHGPP